MPLTTSRVLGGLSDLRATRDSSIRGQEMVLYIWSIKPPATFTISEELSLGTYMKNSEPGTSEAIVIWLTWLLYFQLVSGLTQFFNKGPRGYNSAKE